MTLRRLVSYSTLTLVLVTTGCAFLNNIPEPLTSSVCNGVLKGWELLPEKISGDREILGHSPRCVFPALYCCVVVTALPWERSSPDCTLTSKSIAGMAVKASLWFVSAELYAKASETEEVSVKNIETRHAKNITHFYIPGHCDDHLNACKHEPSCENSEASPYEFCIAAMRVGEISYSSNVSGGAGVTATGPGAGGTAGATTGKDVENKPLKNVIIAYKVTTETCGKNSVTVRGFSQTINVGAGGKDPDGKTYKDYVAEDSRTRSIEKTNRDEPSPPNEPNNNPKILQAETASPTRLLAPPPEHVISGEVIRVTTADSSYNPHPPLGGIVVDETDTSGKTTTRTVQTNSKGSAWIQVGVDAAIVGVAVGAQKLFTASVRNPGESTQGQAPAITSIQPYLGKAPPGKVEAGTLVELNGTHCGTPGEILVDGKATKPLAAGDNYALGRLSGQGPVQVQLRSLAGSTSPSTPVVLVKLSPEVIPPPVLSQGQTAEVAIRFDGTTDPVPLQCTLRSEAVTFDDGSQKTRVLSSGGPHNVAHVRIKASHPGHYELDYSVTE